MHKINTYIHTRRGTLRHTYRHKHIYIMPTCMYIHTCTIVHTYKSVYGNA